MTENEISSSSSSSSSSNTNNGSNANAQNTNSQNSIQNSNGGNNQGQNQTPMNVKFSTLEHMIKPFSGDRNKLYQFIDNCDTAVKLAANDQKPVLLDIIKCNILDSARHMIRNRDFNDWSELRTYLIEAYTDRRSHGQWQTELHSCIQKPGQDVLSYGNRVEFFLAKLMNSLDPGTTPEERKANVKYLQSEAKEAFIRGLNGDLYTLVKSQNPTSLEDAIAIAQTEEIQLKSKGALSRISRSNLTEQVRKLNIHDYNVNRNQNQNQNRYNANPNNFNRNQGNFHQNRNQQRNNFSGNFNKSNTGKFCNYCKNVGHEIAECRKRQYNNAIRGQNKTLNAGNSSGDSATPENMRTPRAE